MAAQRTLNRWIFQLVRDRGLPEDFDFTLKQPHALPETIVCEIEAIRKTVRQHSVFYKPFLPVWFVIARVFRQPRPKSLELQEAIIYDLMILTWVAVLCRLGLLKWIPYLRC
jgi:hypothetical protein